MLCLYCITTYAKPNDGRLQGAPTTKTDFMPLPQLAAFHLLHPTAGLLALLGLLLPLLIYLWNRRPGRTVQVGSLRWLETAANRRMRRLNPEQLLLFLLRAGVVALLALAVAGLAWQRPPQPVRGQVLVGPELLRSAALAAVRPRIDSLRRRGYELRQLRRGFPALPARTWALLDSLPGSADSLVSLTADNLWARTQQAADSFPNRPIRVFTTARLAGFMGTRPALPARLRWQLVPTADSTRWVQAAALVGADSLRLVVGRSTENQTSFQAITVHKPTAGQSVRVAGLPALRYLTTDSGAVVQSTADQAMPVAVRPGPVRVWLQTDAAHTDEARYWKAAVQAASLGFAAPLQLTASTELPKTDMPVDILIWLTNAPVPAAWQQRVAQGLHVWYSGAAASQPVDSQFAPPATTTPIAVQRLDTVNIAATEWLWTNAIGRPVLTRQRRGQGAVYRLHTRLQPAWSGLGENPALPALLLPLLQPEAAPTLLAHYDQRLLAPTQLRQPEADLAKEPTVQAGPTTVYLRPWVVLAAALLFALERLVAGLGARRVAASPSESATSLAA